MILTGKEVVSLQYILPVQGSLQTLALVQNIMDKAKIDDINSEKDVPFEKEEIAFLRMMIDILDREQQLHISSLSLIGKILIKGDNPNG